MHLISRSKVSFIPLSLSHLPRRVKFILLSYSFSNTSPVGGSGSCKKKLQTWSLPPKEVSEVGVGGELSGGLYCFASVAINKRPPMGRLRCTQVYTSVLSPCPGGQTSGVKVPAGSPPLTTQRGAFLGSSCHSLASGSRLPVSRCVLPSLIKG